MLCLAFKIARFVVGAIVGVIVSPTCGGGLVSLYRCNCLPLKRPNGEGVGEFVSHRKPAVAFSLS